MSIPTADTMSEPNRFEGDQERERIVVGYDGSGPSERALAWAAHEAQLRKATLEIVYAELYREEALEALDPQMIEEEKFRLDRAVAEARLLAPDIPVFGRLCDPPAGRALIEASAGADLLVVGSRGLGAMKEIMLGSVSNECVHHALCPVVLIRADGPEPTDPSRHRSTAVTPGRTAEQ
jgi:nucleotide-binding universal stress UspA family protein